VAEAERLAAIAEKEKRDKAAIEEALEKQRAEVGLLLLCCLHCHARSVLMH
jgi:hypothetical protein